MNNTFQKVSGDPSMMNFRLKICKKTCKIEERNAAGDWKRFDSFPHPVNAEHAARLKTIYGLPDDVIAKITNDKD